MDLAILRSLGLNQNDVKVYASLLQNGRSKTGAIIKDARVSSSSAYASLSALIGKGLVSFQVKNNIKYYQAESPAVLIDEAKARTRALEGLSREISILPIVKNERNEINVFEGEQGFKRAHELMVEEAAKGSEIRAITYSKHYGKSKQVRRFFASMDHRLFAKRCRIRLIVDEPLKDIIVRDRHGFAKKYEFRCLPSEYFSPSGINLSDSMLVIGVWDKKPIAFTIRNKAIIESFRTNFDFLWSKGRK